MKICPVCRNSTKVIDVRTNDYGEAVRVRECKTCGNRSVTEELVKVETMRRWKDFTEDEESI